MHTHLSGEEELYAKKCIAKMTMATVMPAAALTACLVTKHKGSAKAYLQVSLVVTCIISIHLISQEAKASTSFFFFARQCKIACQAALHIVCYSFSIKLIET